MRNSKVGYRMKTREVMAIFEGKLEFSKSERHRHIGFTVKIRASEIPLPTLIRITRASGELPANNVGGLATALGMRETDFAKMVRCRIGRRLVMLSLCLRLLRESKRKMDEEGVVFEPGARAMCQSVSLILDDLEARQGQPVGREGTNVMAQCMAAAMELLPHVVVGPVATRIRDMLLS